MSIRSITENLISFDISCVTGPTGFHVATVETDTVAIAANQFDYHVPGTEKCRFRIKFYKDFAVISYVDHQYDCGFGLNATVDGIFLRMK